MGNWALSQLHIPIHSTKIRKYKDITYFNCILGRKKRKLICRKKKSNHIKRKIDVPLEQETDDDDGDDDDDGGQQR